MRKIKINILTIGTLLLTLVCSSCDNFFDIDTDEIAPEDKNYTARNEVYSGLIGVAASFQQAADHYIVVSELLGDLIEPTSQAPVEFWDVYRYRATNGNSLVSPEPFYNIIVNSNDFIRHAVKFHEEVPRAIPDSIYTGMISTAITYRAWAYLTIGKLYGEAVYYDLALTDDTDLSKQRILSFDALIDELIYFVKNGVDGIDGFHSLNRSKIFDENVTDWAYIGINPDVLMCELYLWDGNNVEAAQSGLGAIVAGTKDDGTESTDKYKLSASYKGASWKNMFSGSFSTLTNEAFTAVPFDYSKNQTNKLQYYFSNIAPNVYYLKPHTQLINRYRNSKGGNDYRGENASYIKEGDNYVFSRYHLKKENYKHDSHIFIYRAADVWLMVAEALSNLGDIAQADSILNVGLKTSQDGSKFKAPFDYPIYNWNLRECIGVRGRAGVTPDYLCEHVIDSLFTDETLLAERKKFVLDSLIAEEVARESAGEGKRWFTLMRMARNAGKPEILADPISAKFSSAERQLYRIWLMNPENWYIKYDQVTDK
ncbi:MAG: RagB/SusD family nutrient uptake outer membrane protein [Odoribacter splanchnicus]|nr:RagB/SusD family nutrient uptake outer membrane protein [Odoribacter splanchnicus]